MYSFQNKFLWRKEYFSMRVRKMKSVDVQLHDSTKVKLKTAGNTSVVQFTAGVNKSCPVQNLSKDTYLDKKTGEVKQKKRTENRYQSPKSVRKSINRLMDLIRCNATDSAKCKWIDESIDEDDSAKPVTVEKIVDGVSKQFTKGER